jgi:hypothetical protein
MKYSHFTISNPLVTMYSTIAEALIYTSRGLKLWNLNYAKAPAVESIESDPIFIILGRFSIVQPRELSRCTNFMF